MIEMLRLCPGDNLDQRYWRGSVLLKAGRAAFFAHVWLHLPKHVDWPPRGGCAFEPPINAPLSSEFIESKKKWGDARCCTQQRLHRTNYGVAVKLRGSTYLRIAASADPYVLVKILANVDQPSESFDSLPAIIFIGINARAESISQQLPNGPEEAHDYLWLTQDLWMSSHVWNWVNNYGGCKEVVRCGQACQKEDWPAHKKSMCSTSLILCRVSR